MIRVEFKNEHVDVFHIEGQSDISSLGKSTSSPLSTDTCQHRYHGKQYRVNGKSWIKDYEFYGSAGTQTYHYKRINNFGGYHTRRVNHIAVATTVNLYNYGMHHSYTNHTVSNHESHVVVFTFQGGGLSSAGIHGYIDSHHHVRRSDGTTAGCGTYVSRQPS